MSDDIRTLTAQLAEDPASLAFLDLADLLRRRGQLDAALTVAANGLARYPELADAHALRARILAERGDGDAAFDGWMSALQLDSAHQGAHRGLGFLYFRSGDLARALRHLEYAARSAPGDRGLESAIARVRATAAADHAAIGAVPPPPDTPPATPDMPFSFDADGASAPVGDADLFAGLEGARDGLLLLDQHGLRRGGAILDDAGAAVPAAGAPHLAGVSGVAPRAARLLGLGAWQSVAVECADGNAHLVAPTADTVLLTVRDVSVPAGRLAIVADRAAQAARRWLAGLS
jgi:tetratricopeptide (TPR) repeat protein